MGMLHDQIKHELKIMAHARSRLKKSEERLAGFVDQLLRAEDSPPPPVLPPPPPPIDEAERRSMLKRLRKLGYVPKP